MQALGWQGLGYMEIANILKVHDENLQDSYILRKEDGNYVYIKDEEH